MVGTRSGGKRKEKAPQQTPKKIDGSDQDYPYSPPFPVQLTAKRSPLRSALRNIKKSAPNPTSLIAATRVLNEPIPTNTDTKFLGPSSPVVKLGLVHEQSMTDVKPTGPPNLVFQFHVCQDVTQDATLHGSDEDIHDNFPPSRENYVVSHLEDTVPGKSTTCYAGKSSQCLSTSLNLTEFAKRQLDDEDDDDEVESALDPAFDYVNGHKVKRENVPLLRAIFDKYGDITNETEGQPPTIVSFFLERICAIYERLKGTKFSKITRKDLNEMLDEVRFLEREKLNVRWLHEKLEHIYNTKMSSQNYLSAKEDSKKCDVIIRSLEGKLEVHKREVSLIEEKLVEERDKADRNKKMASDIKARVDDLRAFSLVHGLL